MRRINDELVGPETVAGLGLLLGGHFWFLLLIRQLPALRGTKLAGWPACLSEPS
jgi:hypothetical protein